MERLSCWLAAALAVAATASFTSADDPITPAGSGPEAVFKIGEVSYKLPFGLPSREEILRALPTKDAKIGRIQCELIRYQLNEPRVFPMVGRARLVQAHF